MPKVNLVFLAAFREVAGESKITTEASSPRAALIKLDILDQIESQTPIIAVNKVIANLDHPLSDGDEVAIMPPMTGG